MTEEEKKRYRPFRGIAWVAYLILSVGFSVLIIVSVFSSAIAMSPSRPVTGQIRTLNECNEMASALYTELNATYAGLFQNDVIEKADYRFLIFRNDWIARKRSLEAECDIDAADRMHLKAALSSLEKIVDSYTTGSVQFVGGVGPEIQNFRKAISGQ